LQQSAAASSGGSSAPAAERAPGGWGGSHLEGGILNGSIADGGGSAGAAPLQPFYSSTAAQALHNGAASGSAALQAPRQWARTGSGSGSSSGQRSAAFTGSGFSSGPDAAPQLGGGSSLQPGTASGFQLHGELMPPSLPSDAEHWEQQLQPPQWQARPSAPLQPPQPADLPPPSGDSFGENSTITSLFVCSTAQWSDHELRAGPRACLNTNADCGVVCPTRRCCQD
jgi:hypothetical protein